MKHTIDAQGKKIGRIATEAAAILIGKNSTAFARNEVLDAEVEIVNASKVDLTARKKLGMKYVTYTGHRGGLNTETLGQLMQRRGIEEVFRLAIYGMLPSNKLRSIRMKKITVKE